jgi:hypothetical protein
VTRHFYSHNLFDDIFNAVQDGMEQQARAEEMRAGMAQPYADPSAELRVRLDDLTHVATAHAGDIVQLRVVVWTLMQMLAEAKLLDGQLLLERIEANRRAMTNRPAAGAPTAATAGPYRGPGPSTPVPPPLPPTTTCAVCGKNLPVSETLMSERGPVCEACFGPKAP